MKTLINLASRYWFFILLIFLLPTITSLLVPGFFGADDDLHIAWLFEMDKLIRLGQIPPRFVPDLSYGFGYPLFNFVFPLPFYIGELFHLVGMSLVDSVKSVFLISLVLSGLTMYWLMREFSSKLLSFVGAIIYVYSPYRAIEVYLRGAIGEALAFVFLPLVTLSIIKVTPLEKERISRVWVGVGALSLAALILCHNITTYMFFPFIVLLGVMRIGMAKNRLRKGAALAILVLLGLLASSYFWLPALIESNLVKYDTVFNFIDHFPTIKQLIVPYWGYGPSIPGPYDGMSFNIGVVNLVGLVIGYGIWLVKRKKFNKDESIFINWALISFLVAFLMMNYRSVILWQHIPLLPYFQFPWRFLVITTLVSPLFLISLKHIKLGFWIGLSMLAVAVGFQFNYFRPHDFLGRTDSYYLNRYIPVPQASLEYQTLQEEYLRLPVATQIRPNQNYPPAFTSDQAIYSSSMTSELTFLINTESDSPFSLNLNKYYFPGWVGTIDGKDLNMKAGLPFGQINLDLPAGNHHIKVWFQETTFKLILDILSLVTILVSFGVIWNKKQLIKK